MGIREKTKAYFRQKPLRLITDLILLMLIVLLLIPSTRSSFLAGFAKVRTSFTAVPSAPADRQLLSEAVWEMNFKDRDGRDYRLDDFRGRPIFFHQWATWCPGCRAEMAGIQRLYDLERDQVVFILLTDEKPEVVKAFMEKGGYDMPVYYGRTSVPELYSRTIPATAIINREGRMEVWKAGVYDWGAKKVRKKLR